MEGLESGSQNKIKVMEASTGFNIYYLVLIKGGQTLLEEFKAVRSQLSATISTSADNKSSLTAPSYLSHHISRPVWYHQLQGYHKHFYT